MITQISNSLTPTERGTAQKFAYAIGESKKLSYSHLRWGLPCSILLLSSKASPPSLWPPECFFPKHGFILRSAITNSQFLHVFFSSNGTNCGRESLCATSHWGNETVQFPSQQSVTFSERGKKNTHSCLYFSLSFFWFPLPGACLLILTATFFFFSSFLVGKLQCSVGC